MNMEQINYPQPREQKFNFAIRDETDLGETISNPEAYKGCLVRAMRDANMGDGGARAAVESTIVNSHGPDFAACCGRCGITMVHDSGTVYGASNCPLVRTDEEPLGELA